MKYKKVEVKGHQRAGNHYLAYLINENFFNYDNFYKLFRKGSHQFGNKHGEFRDDTLYIYIHREFEATARSLFKIRGRFCIGTDDINDLLGNKPMSSYASKEKPTDIQLDKYTAEAFKKAGDSINRKSQFTYQFGSLSLKEWHTKHINSWLNINKENIIYIKYEDLINDFNNTMLYIAKKLGSDKTEFINIEKKVGVIHKDEEVL